MRRIKLLIYIGILVIQGFSYQLSSQCVKHKLIIQYENLKFSDILDSLSQKFHVNFSYNADLPVLKKLKSISCNAGLEGILAILLNDEGLEYSIKERLVIIYPIVNSISADSTNKKEASLVTIYGTIIDKNSQEHLSFASVTMNKRNISTYANTEGKFIIRVPKQYCHDTIVFSYIGYQSQNFVVDSLIDKEVNIKLSQTTTSISDVVIKSYSGLEIVRELVKNISNNYRDQNAMYTAFYREYTKEENDYISICEAVLDISKAQYNNDLQEDQARVFKGRRSENVKKILNLQYKLEGGVYNCLRLDVIKDMTNFFSEDYFNDYKYEYVKQMEYEGRNLYVIAFDQNKNVQLPLYKGLLYIDVLTNALVAIKFGLSPRGIKYAKNLLVKKHPRKFQVNPLSAEYQVYYRYFNGKWYLAYLRSELKIKAKSNKLFFNSLFTSVSEMVITGIDTTNLNRFRWKEITKSQDIMVDNVSNNDVNFWSNYEVIQPEESLQKAVSKLNIKKDLTTDESLWKKLF